MCEHRHRQRSSIPPDPRSSHLCTFRQRGNIFLQTLKISQHKTCGRRESRRLPVILLWQCKRWGNTEYIDGVLIDRVTRSRGINGITSQNTWCCLHTNYSPTPFLKHNFFGRRDRMRPAVCGIPISTSTDKQKQTRLRIVKQLLLRSISSEVWYTRPSLKSSSKSNAIVEEEEEDTRC